MSINEYKLAFAQRSLQVVLLNQQGVPVESCNTFINLHEYQQKQQSLFEVFPFLDSIKNNLLDLFLNGNEICFPRVEFNHNQKNWFLDNTFCLSPSQPNLIVWILGCLDSDRRYLREIQQERNELVAQKNTTINANITLQRAAQLELLRQTQLAQQTYLETCQKPLNNSLNRVEAITRNLQEYVGNMYLNELNQWIQTMQQQLNSTNSFFTQLLPPNLTSTHETFALSNIVQTAIAAFNVYQPLYQPHKYVVLETNEVLSKKVIGNADLLEQLIFTLLTEIDAINNEIKIKIEEEEEENIISKHTQLHLLLCIANNVQLSLYAKQLLEQLNGTASSQIAANDTWQLSIKLPITYENEN